jgi:hypothetical protein
MCRERTLGTEHSYTKNYKDNHIGLYLYGDLAEDKKKFTHKGGNNKEIIDDKDPLLESSRERAITYLAENIPLDTWGEYRQYPDQFFDEHHGYSLYIRNLIRRSGYNPGSITLDNELKDLVKKASLKVPENQTGPIYCDYCGKIIEGLPYYSKWGQKFCADHKVPESREERGADHLPKDYVTTFHSDGRIEYRK